MAKADLEAYLELRIKECRTLKEQYTDFKDLELYGALCNELDKCLILLRKMDVDSIRVQELHGGNGEIEWTAKLDKYQFHIRRILDTDNYELYLCDQQDPSYMRRIHGEIHSLQGALDKIREEYEGGMLP